MTDKVLAWIAVSTLVAAISVFAVTQHFTALERQSNLEFGGRP